MLYFGYGSNMSRNRIEERLGRVERRGPASVPGWRLAFHKWSRDGSGKCDAVFTGNPADRLWGALDRLSDHQMTTLDRLELGYDRRAVEVSCEGRIETAMLYVARDARIDPRLRPYRWYKDFVLAGARELGLPPEYIACIEEVTPLPDPCPGRAERNRAILTRGRQPT